MALETIPKPLLVDIPTAKAMLADISHATIYRLFEKGVLKKVKLGKKACITLASVEALAANGV